VPKTGIIKHLERDYKSPSPRYSLPLRWSGIGLGAASWVSAAFFGLYTLTFYFGAIPSGHMDQWNIFVPGLYDKRNLPALLAIAAHFAAGAAILILGPVQFIAGLRVRWPWVHRWLGRTYVSAAVVTGLGGLGFIASKGTIGGAVMNIGFGLYGVLVLLAAIKTYQNARRRRWEEHRAWAIRLFALAIGSWLYRMEFGLWLNAVAPTPIGHTVNYRGSFDIVMSFFFYLPNLAVAELFLRAGQMLLHRAFRIATMVVLNAANLVMIVGTYNIVHDYWGPAIMRFLLGRAG
jgi:Predicted membrane protein (DUF2306)